MIHARSVQRLLHATSCGLVCRAHHSDQWRPSAIPCVQKTRGLPARRTVGPKTTRAQFPWHTTAPNRASSQYFSQAASRSPYRYRITDPHRAEVVEADALADQLRFTPTTEAEGELWRHVWAQVAIPRQREQKRLHAAIQIAGVDMQDAHQIPLRHIVGYIAGSRRNAVVNICPAIRSNPCVIIRPRNCSSVNEWVKFGNNAPDLIKSMHRAGKNFGFRVLISILRASTTPSGA